MICFELEDTMRGGGVNSKQQTSNVSVPSSSSDSVTSLSAYETNTRSNVWATTIESDQIPNW